MDGSNFCLPCFERGVLCQSHPKNGPNGPTPPRSAASSITEETETRRSPATSHDIRRSPDSTCRQCQKGKLRCDRKQPCSGCVRTGSRCRSASAAPPQISKKDHIKTLQSRIGHSRSDSIEVNKALRRSCESSASSDLHGSSLDSHRETLSVATDYFTSLSDADLTYPARADVPTQTSTPVDSTPLPIIANDAFNYTDVLPTLPAQALDTFRDIGPLMRADLCLCILSLNIECSDQLYFDRVHSFTPFLHQSSYIRISKHLEKRPTMNSRSTSDESKLSHTCLQYAMWAMASSLSSQFQHLCDTMYREALDRLGNLDSPGSPMDKEEVLLKQTQAWILISMYELMAVGFHRAWVSTGRAIRLIQLLRLSNIDSSCSKASGSAEDPDYFVEKEEKRRTFWMVFCLDTVICLAHDLPRTFTESEIYTRLPCSEDAFQSRTPTISLFLSEAMELQTAAKQHPFLEFILSISMSEQIQVHKNRSRIGHESGTSPAQFSERHMFVDSVLTRQIFRLQGLSVSHRAGSMTLLTRIVAQVASLSLLEVAATMPDTTAEYHHLVDGCEERAVAAAREIARLSRILLSDFNICQIHPFTPAPFHSCRKALVRFQERGMALEDEIKTMNEALGELKAANGFCQGIPKPEPPQFGYEDALATPDSLMDLLIEEPSMGD
ncbi:all development altered-6 [Colletotrichum costaricense]|uniref:All development altered-6 n=1 Tax=Colletotrichum costaricense TaxID=1209916 RepID=A0AAJ0DVV6_9PEZI|nr:all development altered-6 [Colletotrichum costaricense]KAK1516873.1 all development altered-6 [Colletotrichum costaricense]